MDPAALGGFLVMAFLLALIPGMIAAVWSVLQELRQWAQQQQGNQQYPPPGPR